MGPSENRPRTQINMLPFMQAKPQALPGSPLRSSPPKSDTTIKLGKKRERPVEGDPFDAMSDTARGKGKPRMGKSATGGPLPLRTAWESPWERYTKEYDLNLGGPVVVSVRVAPPVELVQVRAFPTSTAEKTLHMFRHIQHNKIVTAIDAFITDDFLYVVLEHMPVTLEHIVGCPAYPDDRQLGAILGQVLEGMVYIASEGFAHGDLSCSNILLNAEGNVKIAHQESCERISQPKGQPRDVKALSVITMKLMQKYVKEGGAIGVDDLRRWHSSSDAVGFLSATTSATSAAELLKHPLLSRPYQKESLIGMISLAQVSIRGRYSYKPPA